MIRQAPRTAADDAILLVRLDALGDLVLTTPMFREIKRAHPHCRLTALVQAKYASIVETNPHVDEVIALPPAPTGINNSQKRWHALRSALAIYRRELRHRHLDAVLSPRWDVDEDLATMLVALSNAPVRIGYGEKTSRAKASLNRGFGKAFTTSLRAGTLRNELYRNLKLVEAMGGAVVEDYPEIHLTSSDREYAGTVLRDVPPDRLLVALGVGAQASGRRWPLENFAAAIVELSRHYESIHPVITCAPQEWHLAVRLGAMLPMDATVEYGPAIRHSCALLERCELFIGNDTGSAHLAAAMGCKTLVISRHPRNGDIDHSNSPARFAPYGPESVVLQPESGRDGCSSHCRRTEPHCILEVTVDNVVHAALELLSHHRLACTSFAESH